MNNLIYQGVGSLETGLFATPPERLGFKPAKTNGEASEEEKEYPDAKQEIEEGLHKLETLLNSTVDKNFDKFEIYVLRNILSVPTNLAQWIRLRHYEVRKDCIKTGTSLLTKQGNRLSAIRKRTNS